MRTSARFHQPLLAALALIALPAAASAQTINWLRVVTANAPVLSRAESRSNTITTVPLDASVEILAREGDWFWVVVAPDAYGTRRAGWLHGADLDLGAAGLALRQPPTADKVAAEGEPRRGAKAAQTANADAPAAAAPGHDEARKPSRDEIRRLKKAERELEAARRQYQQALEAKQPRADADVAGQSSETAAR